jgi:hypothetical protein
MTPQIQASPDATFLANLLKGSRQGIVDWQQVDDTTLRAPLEEGYSVKIEQVPDFEGGQYDDNTPDYVVTLLREDKPLFEVDRRVIESDDLSRALGESVEFTHKVFVEIWRNAHKKVTKVADHLNSVNRLLDRQIRQRP